MKVFARFDTAAARFVANATNESALLLEGAWPVASTSASLWSLDEAIDGRFAWIDAEASRLAAMIECAASNTISQAGYVHALALRYYLVRLVRPIVFFQQVLPENSHAACELFATTGRDEDYALLLAELAVSERFELTVHWDLECSSPQAGNRRSTQPPENSRWRKLAGRLASWLDRRLAAATNEASTPRIVLCGNPRLLDPICHELVSRRLSVDWLYERFAVRAWLRWSATGVGQLVCHADQTNNRVAASDSGSLTELSTQGVNMGAMVDRWLRQQSTAAGNRWSGFQTRCLEHLRSTATAGLVLDQDATPLARAAIAAAKQLSIPTWVVQHGVPGVRFGFAPLTADRFLATDDASLRQLVDWGVRRERIDVTGSPALEAFRAKLATNHAANQPRQAKQSQPTILLLASTPARDERPDALTFHLTTRTYDELTEMACRAAKVFSGTELLIKPHPRDAATSALRNCLTKFPDLPVTIVREPLEQMLQDVDVVLSCASTAGIEAAALGWPVIQLLPRGSGDLLSAREYGLIGTARSLEELVALLPAAFLQAERRAQNPAPFAAQGNKNIAARRIVDLVYFGGADWGGSPFAPHRATVSMSNCRSIGLAR